VQLYVKAENDNRAIKTLKGFKRISLKANETKNVKFKISNATLTRWIDGKGYTVEPDKYKIKVGYSSFNKDLQVNNLLVQQMN